MGSTAHASRFQKNRYYGRMWKSMYYTPYGINGKKRPGEKGEIKIGNNCYIGTGVTILGPITIGDNVTIAAGAVVVDNIPNDCVIGGIPAKILKYKNKKDIYDK